MTEKAQPGAGCAAAEAQLRQQRDLARAGAILAAALAAVMLWSNYGREFPEVQTLHREVEIHRQMLAEHQKLQETVQAARQANEQEVERLTRRHGPR